MDGVNDACDRDKQDENEQFQYKTGCLSLLFARKVQEHARDYSQTAHQDYLDNDYGPDEGACEAIVEICMIVLVFIVDIFSKKMMAFFTTVKLSKFVVQE